MFSDTPSIPGTRHEMPRMFRSTGTPACEARYSAEMQRRSTSELSFMAIRAWRPSWCAATVASISPIIASRRNVGAVSTLRKRRGRA